MMTSEPWRDLPLTGVMDIHVHAGPDARPRWYTGTELADLAAAAGMAGFVLKHHDRPTMPDARGARGHQPNLQVHGGITLNRSAGGLSPANVATALAEGARFVWLPSHDGLGERIARGHTDGLAVTTTNGAVPAEMRRILELIAEADAVLATAHISAEEVTAVIREARRCGVRRIVVNHPEIPFLQFSSDLQKRWRDEGAMLERCFPRPEADNGFDQIAQEAREVGVESTIIATDLGRRDLPSPLEGMRRMIHELATRGFTSAELATMTHHNPLRLIC